MEKKLSWEEMKTLYPDEWLMIVEAEHDSNGRFTAGVVVRHSQDDQEVFRRPALKQSCTFKYTGECQFPGGLRVHADHDHF